MSVIQISKIQVRRGQELQTGIPQLDPGELGWAQDTEHLYIGKRINEGAVDNNNSRILTDVDLKNIFAVIGSTVTQAIAYKYREDVDYITHSATRRLQSKLDDTVSLCDYDVISSTTATDITYQFKLAIQELFFNSTSDSYQRSDARRKLTIPAGNFIISDVILLPPYVTLVGEGAGLTTLTMVSSNTPMFKTVDAAGNTFESNNMQSGVHRARSLQISDITMEYSPTAAGTAGLLLIDNILDVEVTNCTFRTLPDLSSSGSVYGLVSAGTGIELRGQGGGIGSGDVNLCENIKITNCVFDSLLTGVVGSGSVIRPVITNSVFSNLHKGIHMFGDANTAAPSNGYFESNRFENIVNEAIAIDTSIHRTNHVSSNNFFIQVANGLTLDDTATTVQAAVLSFRSEGNRSINDYFQREIAANTNTNPDFYYNPLVVGRATVSNGVTNTATIAMNVTAAVFKLALTGEDQMMSIPYQLTNEKLSRKGNLLINLSPVGYPSITDTYNYSELIDIDKAPTNISFNISEQYALSNNYVILTCKNESVVTDSILEFQINILS